MRFVIKSGLFLFAVIVCLVLPACFGAPASDEPSSSSSTATKSAVLTLIEIGTQRSAASISENDEPHAFGSQAIGSTTRVAFTLYNSGDIPAKSLPQQLLQARFRMLAEVIREVAEVVAKF